MRNHQATEALQSIVAEPQLYSPATVARASCELALRGQGEEALFERKVRISATAALVVGAFCVVWPAIILLMPLPPPQAASPNAPFMFRHFDAIFKYLGLFQAVLGALLLFGGIFTRKRQPLGPTLVVAALALALAYDIVFSVGFIVTATGFGGPAFFAAFFCLMALANASLFGFLLWLPIRFFASPRVRTYCRLSAV